MQLSLLLGATLASYPLSQWRTGSGCGLTSCGEHHEEQRNESENFAEEQNDGKSSSTSVFAGSRALWEKHAIRLHSSLDLYQRREVRTALL